MPELSSLHEPEVEEVEELPVAIVVDPRQYRPLLVLCLDRYMIQGLRFPKFGNSKSF